MATHFGLSPQALYNWRERGIPHRKRVALAKLAAEHGVSTPPNFFDELTAPVLGSQARDRSGAIVTRSAPVT